MIETMIYKGHEIRAEVSEVLGYKKRMFCASVAEVLLSSGRTRTISVGEFDSPHIVLEASFTVARERIDEREMLAARALAS